MSIKKFKPWKEMTKQEKKKTTINLVLLLLFAIGTILGYVFSSYIHGENSIFNQNISSNKAINDIFHVIPILITTVQIVVICAVVSTLLRWFIRKSFTKTARGITVVKLLDSFIKYVIAIVAFLLVLGVWGVDTATIIASAGILGLVIGLGAQSLIADIIAGVFIVFEGAFQVGDIVVIDGWRGTVEEIGIRTTRLIDGGGNLQIINNSTISKIVNQTKELSVATCTVGIEYGADLKKIEKVIFENLSEIKNAIPAIVEGPFYKGVKALNASSVDLLVTCKCKEDDLYQTQRDLNREIKLLFDKNNINIPFPQVVVNNAAEDTAKPE